MAFTVITAASVVAGEPVTTTNGDTVRLNFDDHESRIITLEGSLTTTDPIKFKIQGEGVVLDGADFQRETRNITLTGIRIMTLADGGDSGTFTFDMEKSAAGGGAFASILSAPVSASTTPFAVVSGTLTTTVITAGDIFKLNIDAIRAGASGFDIQMEYTIT